jgi:hypothetical protein
MQVSHPSINAEPIITLIMYYLHHKAHNPLGNEGVLHLSKGEWIKIKVIYLGISTLLKIK